MNDSVRAKARVFTKFGKQRQGYQDTLANAQVASVLDPLDMNEGVIDIRAVSDSSVTGYRPGRCRPDNDAGAEQTERIEPLIVASDSDDRKARPERRRDMVVVFDLASEGKSIVA